MSTFEIQTMYTLVVLLAFSASLAFGAFLGWLLFERKNAPFKDLMQNEDRHNDLD